MNKTLFILSSLSILIGLNLSACSDSSRFIEKMKLDPKTAEKVKPVLDQYLEKQDQLLKEMENRPFSMERPPMGPNRGEMHRPPSGDGENRNRPDNRTNDISPMESQDNNPFRKLDYQTMDLLLPLVTPEQLQLFKDFAREYRMNKMREKMNDRGAPGGMDSPPR